MSDKARGRGALTFWTKPTIAADSSDAERYHVSPASGASFPGSAPLRDATIHGGGVYTPAYRSRVCTTSLRPEEQPP